MHVFTSMKPEDITPTDSSSRGMHALKDFLAYARSGIIDQPRVTGKEPDSDFEIAVANALYQAGFDVDYQVGLAGFNIDIAVKHPSKPGSYIMGIECDGAAYHSAKSARDRDRLRQEILEIKGWRIRRIWSTDWFKDYKSVLAPIIQELRQISSTDLNK
jgi:very-short-patch-repair endonuclease